MVCVCVYTNATTAVAEAVESEDYGDVFMTLVALGRRVVV